MERLLNKMEANQTIKFMFFSWDNFYSKQIKKITNCKWSHVAIAIDNGDHYIVYEALAKGLLNTTNDEKTNELRYTKERVQTWINSGNVVIKESKEKYDSKFIIENCEKYLGSGYDFLAIFYIFLYSISKKTKKYDNVRNIFCSEFTARASYDISNKKIDFQKEYERHFEYITPADQFNSNQLRFLK